MVALYKVAKYRPCYDNISFFSSSCVIRGRVVTVGERGLPGVRISGDHREGFTISRKDGHFDFLTNCRASKATLKLGKSPFPVLQKTVHVLRNTVSEQPH